jgi:RPA family protein
MDQQPQLQTRQTAYRVQIKDLLHGTYVKEEGLIPNHINVGGIPVSRVNIIGAVVDKHEENNITDFLIDDGSGRITVRDFEKKVQCAVGDIVMVIGRIRQYGSERYVAPEIIKPTDSKWAQIWKKQALVGDAASDIVETPVEAEGIELDESPTSDTTRILTKIKELDDGNGAPYEQIVKTSADEKTISYLLLQGEIFEIRPGRLKILD